MMRFKTLVQFTSILLLVVGFVWPTQAQDDDPTATIVELATQVHIQNLRTSSVTRWVGGDLGERNNLRISLAAGSQFIGWHFTDIYDDSQTVDITDIKRPVLINIWASWCGPCRLEFPILTEYALSETASYDVWFVDAADTLSEALHFLESQPEGIKAYVDPYDFFMQRIGVKGLPTTILMDTDGTILAAHTGEVTYTTMKFFDAVAAYPYEGSLDITTIVAPDLNAVLDPIDIADTLPVVLEQRMAENIDNTTWFYAYRLEGEAGQEYLLTMQALGKDLDPYLVLIGPDGERLAEHNDMERSKNAEIRIVLPETGTYIIVATRFLEREGLGSGRFFLRVMLG